MMHIPHDDCSPESVEARRNLLRANHPLHNKEGPAPTRIPVEQAIAQLAEAKECYEQRLAEIETELKILRDQV
ncbi:hypothetical protein M0R72_19290 [Candidatus Pacearchaeota archaeon]|nr:hypothetical protein [Candidatus Pacearchaeota archaeon]